ncbi:DUF6612 family protein [Alteribacter populi]|uniref:DUF6612 family protein n=1 Tax=Alteribacter populi TaxID=2011011 RepID=UPI000BBA6EA0|nr:DUF6612 family protein [Alteribacter populi]
MKKALLAGCLSATTLLAVACSAESDDGLTAEDILLKSEEAMEELSSYSMTMTTTQEMSAEGDTQELEVDSEVDMLMEPLTMFQSMSMQFFGMDVSYDSYFSEEHGFFMEDPMGGEWMKLSDGFTEELMSISDMQMSPEEQLKPFKDNLEEVSIETEEDHYVITLKGDGLDMDTMKEQVAGITGEGMDDMLGEAFDSMEVHDLEYELFIDRETFYNTEANIFMDTTVDDGINGFDMKQSVHLLMHSFNELDDLEIPADILENAEEVDENELFGEF